MVWAATAAAMAQQREPIACARTPSHADLATRPIGTPSTDADAERCGLGAALLISRGRRCGRGTMARVWHRCGTAPPAAADAERWRVADQNSDQGRGLLLIRIAQLRTILNCRRGCDNPATGTSTGALCATSQLAQVQAYYHAPMRIWSYDARSICGYAPMRVCAYNDMMICAYEHIPSMREAA